MIFHRANSSPRMAKQVSSLIILLIIIFCVGISTVVTRSMENSSQSDELQVFLWGIGLISVFTLILYGLSYAMEKKALVKRERNSSRIYGILNEINQRKQSEEALKKSYESYNRQIELSPESIIILTKENIVFANNEALNLFGAKSMDEIIDKSLLDFIHPDYKYITTHRIQRIYEDEEKVALIDEQFIHQNGDIIDIEVTAILVDYFGKPSIQMIVRDITERKKNEEMYVTFKKAVETSSEATFITDHNGIFKYVNPAFIVLYDYTLEKIIGRSISEIIIKKLAGNKEYETSLKTLLNGCEANEEITYIRKDGTIIEVESSVKPILDETNRIIGFWGRQINVTKQKLIERELTKVNDEIRFLKDEKESYAAELILAKAHAEESDRLKSAFLANMSHEIRTPMNGILGFADLLKDPDFTGEEQQEYISIIEKSGVRMLNIIDNIIDISKIESGQVKVSISEININDRLMSIYSHFKPEVERKGMQIFFKNNLPAKDAIIKTDREKIYTILTNLVKNAIKFTHQGYIEIGYEKKGKYLEFYVKDTGVGIRHNQKDFIFERFRQGSDLLTRTYEGAGLGLSISKAFVKMLGGNIWLDSEEGKGSVFYFTIPYNIESKEKSVVDSYLV